MNMVRFWTKGTRRNLEQAVKDLRVIITSTADAFEGAQRNTEMAIKDLEAIVASTVDALEGTRRAIEVVLARLKQYEETDNEITIGRVVRLVVLFIVLIFLAGFFTINGHKSIR